MPINKKPMKCIDCGIRIRATIAMAKRHGWDVWVGGSRCKSCCEVLRRAASGDLS